MCSLSRDDSCLSDKIYRGLCQLSWGVLLCLTWKFEVYSLETILCPSASIEASCYEFAHFIVDSWCCLSLCQLRIINWTYLFIFWKLHPSSHIRCRHWVQCRVLFSKPFTVVRSSVSIHLIGPIICYKRLYRMRTNLSGLRLWRKFALFLIRVWLCRCSAREENLLVLGCDALLYKRNGCWGVLSNFNLISLQRRN